MNLKWLIYQLFGSVFDGVNLFHFVFKGFQPIAKHNQPNKIKNKNLSWKLQLSCPYNLWRGREVDSTGIFVS